MRYNRIVMLLAFIGITFCARGANTASVAFKLDTRQAMSISAIESPILSLETSSTEFTLDLRELKTSSFCTFSLSLTDGSNHDIEETISCPINIPTEWSEKFHKFAECFGNDFQKALIMKTGKVDGAGKELLVWQDYVVGTDPTNPNDTFKISIVFVDAKPRLVMSPDLPPEEKSLRRYTVYGKRSLRDSSWTVIQDQDDLMEFKFFKISVEMR